MKIELKHLAPYLPYKLMILDTIKKSKKVMNTGQGTSKYWVGIKTVLNYAVIVYKNKKGGIYKPILRPLSDLTKLGSNETWWKDKIAFGITRGLDYDSIQKLLSEHYDIFGLIEKGLAIDINTLENEIRN